MLHGLCLHRNHNLHHKITQDEDTDENRHLWPHGFWLFVRSLPNWLWAKYPSFFLFLPADCLNLARPPAI